MIKELIMKTLQRLVLIAMVCVSAPMALANGKIAVVDFQKAMLNTDVAKAQIEKLESNKDYQENLNSAKALQKKGQDLMLSYQKEEPMLSNEKKLEFQSKMKGIDADFRHLQGKLQEQEKQALAPVMLQMQGLAQKAVGEIRQNEGFGLVLVANPQIVLYADTSFDITAKVTERLNKATK